MKFLKQLNIRVHIPCPQAGRTIQVRIMAHPWLSQRPDVDVDKVMVLVGAALTIIFASLALYCKGLCGFTHGELVLPLRTDSVASRPSIIVCPSTVAWIPSGDSCVYRAEAFCDRERRGRTPTAVRTPYRPCSSRKSRLPVNRCLNPKPERDCSSRIQYS